jgi:TatD DNase family protein
MIDSHCHLQMCNEPLDSLLAGAVQNAVTGIFCTSTHLLDWPIVYNMVYNMVHNLAPNTGQHCKESSPLCRAAYGVHPWYVNHSQPSAWHETLPYYLQQPSTFALGEVGLDFCKPDMPAQIEQLQMQLQILKRINATRQQCKPKPSLGIVVHCVKAWSTLLPILQEYFTGGGTATFVQFHAYNAPAQITQQLIQLPCSVYFSFNAGVLTSKKMQKALLSIPLDSLLLESDAPAFAIAPLGESAPAHIATLVPPIAQLLNMSEKQFRLLLSHNENRFWNPNNP